MTGARDMKSGATRFDIPTPDDDTLRYWNEAGEGRLLIKRCGSCGAAHHYPRPFCPRCWSPDVAWEVASGRGRLYTYSIVYQNDLPPFNERIPYVPAIVDLVEGPRVVSEIEGCPLESLRVGMEVEVQFRHDMPGIGGVQVFRPLRDA